MTIKTYDMVIIGAGPAGLTAALTAARASMNVVVLSREEGGYMPETFLIENYPGLPKISGKELTDNMTKQVLDLGVHIFRTDAKKITKVKEGFMVTTTKKEYLGKTVLLAIGCERRRLNIPGEEIFEGKGVSYCTTTDGPKFRGRIVGIVGGSDSAASAAIYLSEFAKKVYIFFRGEKLSCEPTRREFIRKCDKINLIQNTNITDIRGKSHVESVLLEDGREIRMDGIFIVVGSAPSMKLSEQQSVACDGSGFIMVNTKQETSVPGIYAAGDITTASNRYRQIITACSEGAIAAESAFRALK